MSSLQLVLVLGKILLIVLFLVTMAAIASWADRRQSAMVQDRIGPHRAVVFLPNLLARALVFAPAFILGGLAIYTFMQDVRGAAAMERATLAIELSVFVGWFSLLVLCGYARKNGAINGAEERLAATEPRAIFYVGLGLHAVGFILARLIPTEALPIAVKVAGIVLGVLIFSAGFYAASRLSEGKVGLRLLGMLHPLADAVKMLWKEDFIPKRADRLLHSLAPILALFSALVTFAVIPFGDTLCFQETNNNRTFDWSELSRLTPALGRSGACPIGHRVGLQIADLNVGILYLFAMAGTGIVGAALAGWASDNKFSLLGGLRAASQMVSYEVAMGLSLVGLFMIYGTVRMQPMADWQGDNAWGVFVQPVAFFLFLAALAAETKRVPFDQPEGESEIVAGYFVEYSGMKFGMFFLGEYIELITSSALLVTLFFGSYNLPFLHPDGITVAFGDTTLWQFKMTHFAVAVIQVLTFFGKVILMAWLQIFFRWTLPRFRYDQVMRLGWTRLLPLAIANMMVTGIVLLAVDSAGAGVLAALKVAADVTQAVVLVGMLAAVVALIAGLLEPVERRRFLKSSSARFAEAAGGVKATPQQT